MEEAKETLRTIGERFLKWTIEGAATERIEKAEEMAYSVKQVRTFLIARKKMVQESKSSRQLKTLETISPLLDSANYLRVVLKDYLKKNQKKDEETQDQQEANLHEISFVDMFLDEKDGASVKRPLSQEADGAEEHSPDSQSLSILPSRSILKLADSESSGISKKISFAKKATKVYEDNETSQISLAKSSPSVKSADNCESKAVDSSEKGDASEFMFANAEEGRCDEIFEGSIVDTSFQEDTTTPSKLRKIGRFRDENLINFNQGKPKVGESNQTSSNQKSSPHSQVIATDNFLQQAPTNCEKETPNERPRDAKFPFHNLVLTLPHESPGSEESIDAMVNMAINLVNTKPEEDAEMNRIRASENSETARKSTDGIIPSSVKGADFQWMEISDNREQAYPHSTDGIIPASLTCADSRWLQPMDYDQATFENPSELTLFSEKLTPFEIFEACENWMPPFDDPKVEMQCEPRNKQVQSKPTNNQPSVVPCASTTESPCQVYKTSHTLTEAEHTAFSPPAAGGFGNEVKKTRDRGVKNEIVRSVGAGPHERVDRPKKLQQLEERQNLGTEKASYSARTAMPSSRPQGAYDSHEYEASQAKKSLQKNASLTRILMPEISAMKTVGPSEGVTKTSVTRQNEQGDSKIAKLRRIGNLWSNAAPSTLADTEIRLSVTESASKILEKKAKDKNSPGRRLTKGSQKSIKKTKPSPKGTAHTDTDTQSAIFNNPEGSEAMSIPLIEHETLDEPKTPKVSCQRRRRVTPSRKSTKKQELQNADGSNFSGRILADEDDVGGSKVPFQGRKTADISTTAGCNTISFGAAKLPLTPGNHPAQCESMSHYMIGDEPLDGSENPTASSQGRKKVAPSRKSTKRKASSNSQPRSISGGVQADADHEGRFKTQFPRKEMTHIIEKRANETDSSPSRIQVYDSVSCDATKGHAELGNLQEPSRKAPESETLSNRKSSTGSSQDKRRAALPRKSMKKQANETDLSPASDAAKCQAERGNLQEPFRTLPAPEIMRNLKGSTGSSQGYKRAALNRNSMKKQASSDSQPRSIPGGFQVAEDNEGRFKTQFPGGEMTNISEKRANKIDSSPLITDAAKGQTDPGNLLESPQILPERETLDSLKRSTRSTQGRRTAALSGNSTKNLPDPKGPCPSFQVPMRPSVDSIENSIMDSTGKSAVSQKSRLQCLEPGPNRSEYHEPNIQHSGPLSQHPQPFFQETKIQHQQGPNPRHLINQDQFFPPFNRPTAFGFRLSQHSGSTDWGLEFPLFQDNPLWLNGRFHIRNTLPEQNRTQESYTRAQTAAITSVCVDSAISPLLGDGEPTPPMPPCAQASSGDCDLSYNKKRQRVQESGVQHKSPKRKSQWDTSEKDTDTIPSLPGTQGTEVLFEECEKLSWASDDFADIEEFQEEEEREKSSTEICNAEDPAKTEAEEIEEIINGVKWVRCIQESELIKADDIEELVNDPTLFLW